MHSYVSEMISVKEGSFLVRPWRVYMYPGDSFWDYVSFSL